MEGWYRSVKDIGGRKGESDGRVWGGWVGGGGGGGCRENRQAVNAGKICYRRGNATWQLSMATAGGSGLKFAFLC